MAYIIKFLSTLETWRNYTLSSHSHDKLYHKLDKNRKHNFSYSENT